MAERVYVHVGLPKTATTYLQTILWVTKAAGYGNRWEDLAKNGLATPFEVRQIKRNEALLSLSRARLHVTANRREDRLVFDLPGDWPGDGQDGGGYVLRFDGVESCARVWLNGTELGSGSIRIHRKDVPTEIFKTLGMTEEEAHERFGFFLDALEYGTPPHGGIALGLDRIVMILAGAQSLREVIAFPKTAKAIDLMVDAPTPVGELQLKELNLRIQHRT